MSEIKCILFDIGGVLVDWHMSWITSEVSRQFDIDESKITEGFSKYLHELDSGNIDEKMFWQKIAADSNSTSLKNNTESLWNTYFRKNAKPNIDVIQTATKLSDTYMMGIISNIEQVTHNVVQAWNVLDPFEHKFMSYKIGFSKPDHRIYKHVINELRLEPNQLVFIDDKEPNVESAKELGIQAIHFREYPSLKKSLEDLQLI